MVISQHYSTPHPEIIGEQSSVNVDANPTWRRWCPTFRQLANTILHRFGRLA
jgi:hypothetical protein